MITDVIPDPEGTGSEQRTFSFLLAYSKFCDVELWCQPRADHPNARRLSKLHDLVSEIFVYYPCVFGINRTLKARFTESLAQAHAVHLEKLPIEVKHPRLIWDVDELPPAFRMSPVAVLADDFKEEPDPLVRRWSTFSKSCSMVMCSSTLEISPLMSNTVIVPNCYSSPPTKQIRRSSKKLLFVGHMGYPPNVEAVDYFHKEILPKLPLDYSLQIVGKKPLGRIHQSLLDSIAEDPRVDIQFDVASCSPFYADALAAVVPLLQGSGTRYKILEAFAHDCPVVTTSKGCEGHPVKDGQHLIIRDDTEAFAAACEQLGGDAQLASQLTRSASDFLERNNSQQAFEDRLLGYLREKIPTMFE